MDILLWKKGFFSFFFTKVSMIGERSKTLRVMKCVWRVNLTTHFSFTIDDKRPKIADVVFSGWPNTGVQLWSSATRRRVSDFSSGYFLSFGVVDFFYMNTNIPLFIILRLEDFSNENWVAYIFFSLICIKLFHSIL